MFTQQSGAGTLTGSGHNFVLDFGTLLLGSSGVSADLAVLNEVLGSADLLDGSFGLTPDHFLLSGFDPFANISAGELFDGLLVSLADTSTAGLFSADVVLQAFGHNASGYSGSLGNFNLHIQAQIASSTVPEPDTLALMVAALLMMPLLSRRRAGKVK